MVIFTYTGEMRSGMSLMGSYLAYRSGIQWGKPVKYFSPFKPNGLYLLDEACFPPRTELSRVFSIYIQQQRQKTANTNNFLKSVRNNWRQWEVLKLPLKCDIYMPDGHKLGED